MQNYLCGYQILNQPYLHLQYEESKNSKLPNEFKLQNLDLTGLIVYADLTFYLQAMSLYYLCYALTPMIK